jgi:hypothetical protein
MFLSSYSNFSSSIETNVRRKRDRLFTVSSNDCKAWAVQGAELLGDFMADEGEYDDL